jgi:hypothetical protein
MKRLFLLLIACSIACAQPHNDQQIRSIRTDTIRPYIAGHTTYLIGTFKVNGSTLNVVDTSRMVKIFDIQNGYTIFDSLFIGQASTSTGVLRFDVGEHGITRLTASGGTNQNTISMPDKPGTLIVDSDTTAQRNTSDSRYAQKGSSISEDYVLVGDLQGKVTDSPYTYDEFMLKTDTLATVATHQYVDSSLFDPTTSYEFYDDFDVADNTTGSIGRMSWKSDNGSGASTSVDTTVAGTLGAFYTKTGTAVNSYSEIHNPTIGLNSYLGAFLGNQAFTLRMRIKNTTATNPQKRIYFGMVENYDTPAIGIYFYADSLAYRCVTNNGIGGLSKDSLTTKTQTNAWRTFTIVSTGSSVKFYIGDTLVSTNTTHIPTTGMKYEMYVKNVGSVTDILSVDYFWCKMKGLSR